MHKVEKPVRVFIIESVIQILQYTYTKGVEMCGLRLDGCPSFSCKVFTGVFAPERFLHLISPLSLMVLRSRLKNIPA